MRKPIGIILLVIGILLILFVLYENSMLSQQTRIFSSYSLLTSSWENYKKQFIKANGQSIDLSQNDITTSEAQSYAMLRAVWIDDKPTFDLVYTWTHTHLKRKNDNLFGWRYGRLPNGTSGFLPNGGSNSATDADSDIAFALILAARRWNDEKYLQDAKPIISDIWRTETATASASRYVIAGNWAQDKQQLIINPSYFAPYEWRAFAQVDTEDTWQSLITPSYQLLHAVGTAPLDKSKGVGLPPDWVAINRTTGALAAPPTTTLTTNYSFDAMRIPWRIALDYQWNKDREAYDYLTTYQFLFNDYEKNHTLVSTYSHDGNRVTDVESPAIYATTLGYFVVLSRKDAAQIYQDKIVRLYSNDQNTFNPKLPYYEQNWLWFGAALYNNFLTDFH